MARAETRAKTGAYATVAYPVTIEAVGGIYPCCISSFCFPHSPSFIEASCKLNDIGPGNLLLSRLGTPLSAKHRSGYRAACTEKRVSKREVDIHR